MAEPLPTHECAAECWYGRAREAAIRHRRRTGDPYYRVERRPLSPQVGLGAQMLTTMVVELFIFHQREFRMNGQLWVEVRCLETGQVLEHWLVG